MTDPTNIEDAFLHACGQISGVKFTAAPEPLAIDLLPAVTLYFIGCPQETDSTGYDVVTWTWQVGVTVPLNDLQDAQRTLQSLLPSLMRIVRTNPDLDATCDWALLDDRDEPPTRSADNKSFRKNLYLTAQTTEN